MKFTKISIIVLAILLIVVGSTTYYYNYNKIKDITLIAENEQVVELNKNSTDIIKNIIESKIPADELENKDVSYSISYRTKNKDFLGILNFDTHKNLATYSCDEGVFASNYELIEYFDNFNWDKLVDSYKNEISFTIDGDDIEVSNFTLFKINHNNANHPYKSESEKYYSTNYESNVLGIKVPENHYKNVRLELFKDRKLLETIADFKDEKVNLPDDGGTYKYVITALYESKFLNYEDKYDFVVEIKGKEFMTVPDFKFRQGDLVPVNIENCFNADYHVLANHLEDNLKVYSVNNKNLVFVPIPSYYDKDKVELKLYKNEKEIASTNINVNIRDFEVQNLTIKRSAQKLKTRDRLREDREKLRQAKSISNNTPYFTEKFIYPVEDYRVTTTFQAIRNVNNGFMKYRHSGIDMAKPMGTPIKCSNNGVITFAEETYSGGNTIVVDHGVGIFTQYMHLSKINVKKGDKVSKGDIIGEVGSTGFSTGPHLHFDMCKYLTFVDPEEMIKHDILNGMK